MFADRFRAFSLSFLPLTLLATITTAQTSSPVANQEAGALHAQLQSRIFPQTKLAECDNQGTIYSSADFIIIIRGSALIIQGHDSAQHSWTAQTSFNGPGCQIFQADLNRNGHQDLLILTPGIGSQGQYDSHLTILLFNAAGMPTPWSATGRFSANALGINEVSSTSSGEPLIQHSYAIGHPAWGGVTYISSLYAVAKGNILPVNGAYNSIAYPVIHGQMDNDLDIRKSIGATNLTTLDLPRTPQPESQSPKVSFVRFGRSASKTTPTPNSAPVPAEQGANPMVDGALMDANRELVELSDGSRVDIPTIVIIDSTTGTRRIIFNPDGTDMASLEKASYQIQQAGTDCRDSDDCRPFTIRATEQKPQ